MYAGDKSKVQQQLISLNLFSNDLTGKKTAAELNKVVFTRLQLEQICVMATMRDGASVNGTAMRLLKGIYPGVINIPMVLAYHGCL